MKKTAHLFLYALTSMTLLISCSRPGSSKVGLVAVSDNSGGTSDTGSSTSSSTGGSTGGTTSGSTSGSSTSSTAVAALSCTATPSSLTVSSGGLVSVTVAAQNGLAPYSIPQFVSSFGSSATITPTRTYTNYSNGTVQETRTVTIKDAAGSYTSCNFTVNVLSASNPSYLNCAVTASPQSPVVGQPVTFTIKAANGSSNYAFSNFVPEAFSGASITQDGSNTATVTYTYNSAGTRYAYASVTSGNSSSICSAAQIDVRQPKLTVATNPSSGVEDVSRSIVVTVLSEQFSSQAVINFNYVVNESGVTVTASNNTFTVRSSNGQVHDFSMVINASASTGETASVTVPLKFTAQTPICLIVPPVGQKIMNVDYRMDVLAQNSEALEIYSFNPSGGLFSQDLILPNVFYARWLSGGNKLIDGIKVRSKTTKALCNGNGNVSAIIADVKSRLLGCSVANGSGISKEGQQVPVTATLVGGVGPFNVTVTSVGSEIFPLQPNQVGMNFFTAGTYTINATVKDLFDNSVVACQAQQTVTENSGILATLYNTYCDGWGYRFTHGITNYPYIQSVVLGAFHIYDWFIGNFPGTNTKEWFVVQMKSKLHIPEGKAGYYTFKARTDDGTRITVDGTVVLLSDNMQPAANIQGSSIYLSEGMHDLTVDYYNGGAHQTFNIQWLAPGASGYGQIPADQLFQP